MIYQGSKRRIAKHILPFILEDRKPDQYVAEPFCGGCNLTSEITGPRIANDLHPELMAFWNAYVYFGFELPYITEEFYKAVKKDRSLASKALQGYMGFNFAFGGKYFDSWAGADRGSEKQNIICYGKRILTQSLEHCMNDSVMTHTALQLPKLKGVEFRCKDYRDLIIPENSIIYCDPPYINTAKYKKGINHDEFWAQVTYWKMRGHQVFVSEYSAPDWATCIWEKSNKSGGHGKSLRTERLYKI